MADVLVEELEGGPTLDLSRLSSSAQRPLKVGWGDVPALLDLLYPETHEETLPGWPGLYVDRVRIDPFDPTAPDGSQRVRYQDSGLNSYSKGGARVSISYATRPLDQQHNSGPGGANGSAGGQNVTFLSHKVEIGGEFLTFPSQGCKFRPAHVPAATDAGTLYAMLLAGGPITDLRLDPGGVAQQPGNILTIDAEELLILNSILDPGPGPTAGTQKLQVQRAVNNTVQGDHGQGARVQYVPATASQNEVGEDVKVGVIIPTIEHHLTWNYVLWPPWGSIRKCCGKVNASIIMGALPECLLFLGCSAHRELTRTQLPFWTIEYKFIEKCINYEQWNPLTNPLGLTIGDDDGNIFFEPQGWNHFLRPGQNGGTFEKVFRKDGSTIYQLAAFTGLFIPGASI